MKKKSYIFILISLIITGDIFCQKINLPDVKTVAEEENLTADNSSLPDFSDVIIKPQGSGAIVPELPSVENEGLKPDLEIAEKNYNKSVFAEFLIGGGYPGLIYSNCSVMEMGKKNPLKFLFNYESASGYKGSKISHNYYDRTIDISLEKSFKFNNSNLSLLGNYISLSNGLQEKVSNITSLNKDYIFLNSVYNYDFNNGFYAGGQLDLGFYNRFGNTAVKQSKNSWSNSAFIFELNPRAFGLVSGYGVTAGIFLDYLLNFNTSSNIGEGSNNRGKVTLGLQWHNNIAKAFSNVSLVFGSKIGEKNSILVPFTLGVDFLFPVYFANRMFRIVFEGGLKTESNSVYELESKYNFTALTKMPTETSFWYGEISIDVPIKDTITGNFFLKYNETAYGNGPWYPKYCDEELNDGLYKYYNEPKQILATNIAFTYHYKLFSIKAGLYSNWLDVPEMESLQKISVNVSFQDKNAKWGTSLEGIYNVNSSFSNPEINLDCFTQLSSSVRVTASFKDIVSLFSSKTRNVYGQYRERGFNGAIVLKFVL